MLVAESRMVMGKAHVFHVGSLSLMKLIIRIGRVIVMIGLIDTIVKKLGIDSTLFIIGLQNSN